MVWADYRKGSKRAKVHLGFDFYRSIPLRKFFSDGKAGKEPLKIVAFKVDGFKYWVATDRYDLQQNKLFLSINSDGTSRNSLHGETPSSCLPSLSMIAIG
jgi:hypothetical protein